jgi:hypothetical protein
MLKGIGLFVWWEDGPQRRDGRDDEHGWRATESTKSRPSMGLLVGIFQPVFVSPSRSSRRGGYSFVNPQPGGVRRAWRGRAHW